LAAGPGPYSETEVPGLPEEQRGSLTLAEVRRRALANNPAYLAELRRLDVARADLRAAGTYPFNPQAEFESLGSLTDGRVGRYEARLGQEIEWAGQRGLRTGASAAGVAATHSDLLDGTRRLLADVERAYVALAAAEERLAVSGQIESLNTRLLEAVRVELAEGEISLLEANLAEIETARARAGVLAVEREVTSAALTLGRLMGDPPDAADALDADADASLALTMPLDDDSATVAGALAARPDVRAAGAELERSTTLRTLAGREALPNLRISALADRDEANADPRFGLSLGIPIPLFDRNQGLRSRREAEAGRAELAVSATELAVRTEVADALRAYRATELELEIFRSDVLEPARLNQDLLDVAYREGKLDLSSLLLLRDQLLDAELGYWSAWERRQQAVIALRSATGSILDDATEHLPEILR
jgi:cobalt-zinc-cadmium efflux system outer membrane protein